MEDKVIIANNIKQLREACGFKQEGVANYLGIKRSTYSNYETGDREMPLLLMEKLADLYGCDLFELYSEDKKVVDAMLVTAFRMDELSPNDMEQVAAFKRVVKNYLKMENLLEQ
jgi:transcriptional regulator with XRE-family HTH domain